MTTAVPSMSEERVPAIARAGLWLGPLCFLALLLGPELGLGRWLDLGLDPLQRRVAAVAAWTALWWLTSAQPVGATSLLPAALLPFLGAMDAKTVAPFYMDDLVLLFLGAFLLTRGLEHWNVHRRLALFVLAHVGTQPRRLVLGMMCATAGVSLFVNNTSTTLLMLPIALALVSSYSHCEPRARAHFARAMLLGVAYSASVGGIGTPVGTAPNQIFLGQFRERYPEGPEISFVQWTLAWLPVVILYLPIGWWLLTRVLFRVPSDLGQGGESVAEQRRALGPWNSGERRMAAIFCLAALAWVTRADLELGAFYFQGWGDLLASAGGRSPVSDATVAVGLALVAFVVPSGVERGRPLLDWSTARTLPWDVLLLFGGGFALAGAFKASRLDALIGARLAPWITGQPDWVVVLALVLLVTALSELASNVATTQVMLPIVGQAAVAAGLSPLFAMVPATIAASNGFMLPVATPPNAIVFATGEIPVTTMARVGLVFDLLVAVLVTAVFVTWGRFVLEIGSGIPAWATR
jgi:solute carrier family 13 (sodium-dependent dicarboxylate transporter), member 2/3/5